MECGGGGPFIVRRAEPTGRCAPVVCRASRRSGEPAGAANKSARVGVRVCTSGQRAPLVGAANTSRERLLRRVCVPPEHYAARRWSPHVALACGELITEPGVEPSPPLLTVEQLFAAMYTLQYSILYTVQYSINSSLSYAVCNL